MIQSRATEIRCTLPAMWPIANAVVLRVFAATRRPNGERIRVAAGNSPPVLPIALLDWTAVLDGDRDS